MSDLVNNENSMSESINELAGALSKAQSVMESALKDATNPFFKSKYADLSSVWNACKKPLTDNGLCIVQQLGGDVDQVTMTTILMHSSGQWIKSTAKAIPAKKDAQSIGSTATYLRRYGLSALVGICTEDDDGNAGSSNPHVFTRAANLHENKPEFVPLTDYQKEIQDWRAHVIKIFQQESSPFYKNNNKATAYILEKTGKALKDLNAVELEELLATFQKQFFDDYDAIHEPSEEPDQLEILEKNKSEVLKRIKGEMK